jgi:hypothetical protein
MRWARRDDGQRNGEALVMRSLRMAAGPNANMTGAYALVMEYAPRDSNPEPAD